MWLRAQSPRCLNIRASLQSLLAPANYFGSLTGNSNKTFSNNRNSSILVLKRSYHFLWDDSFSEADIEKIDYVPKVEENYGLKKEHLRQSERRQMLINSKKVGRSKKAVQAAIQLIYFRSGRHSIK